MAASWVFSSEHTPRARNANGMAVSQVFYSSEHTPRAWNANRMAAPWVFSSEHTPRARNANGMAVSQVFYSSEHTPRARNANRMAVSRVFYSLAHKHAEGIKLQAELGTPVRYPTSKAITQDMGPGFRKEGELCWSLQLEHGKGELLQKAFVLLPLRDGALDSTAPLELRPTCPAEPDLLSPHSAQAALSQECGLRFDITKAFTASENTLQFCVEPLRSGRPAPSSLTEALECPPFLATVWRRHRQPPG
ncbi:hypothetical protein EOD39_19358 [Acipenser ruthenus]|uniref:Uncharacterized protein n=1 Tax=Acipenser ruthenus TaxID=7906 RepID=A0A444UYF7_ACIRT|nr:hypothetical protein EOD39_19358 [Acipenser ruthenus]